MNVRLASGDPTGRPPALTAREHRRLADVLLAAAERRRPIEPLSRRYPELTLADAACIRDVTIARRIAGGERLLGATASGGGVRGAAVTGDGTAPPWTPAGRLTSGMLLAGDVLRLRGLIHPRVEAKVAFRLSAPLAGPVVTAERLLAATDRVLPALEVLDSRYGAVELQAIDAVADNCAATHVRLGDGVPPPDALERLAWRFEVADGAAAASGSPVEGTLAPLAHVVALAQQLVDAGRAPDAGTLLLCSGTATPVALLDGTRVRFICDGLGAVELLAINGSRSEGDGHEH
jgi:2-keto-4-pentenoate hydratase